VGALERRHRLARAVAVNHHQGGELQGVARRHQGRSARQPTARAGAGPRAQATDFIQRFYVQDVRFAGIVSGAKTKIRHATNIVVV
jgi:hypothetical protein